MIKQGLILYVIIQIALKTIILAHRLNHLSMINRKMRSQTMKKNKNISLTEFLTSKISTKMLVILIFMNCKFHFYLSHNKCHITMKAGLIKPLAIITEKNCFKSEKIC